MYFKAFFKQLALFKRTKTTVVLLWLNEVKLDLGLQKGESTDREIDTAWNSVLNFKCQPLLFETVGHTVFV